MAARDGADEFDAVFLDEFADHGSEALGATKDQYRGMITAIIPQLPSARRPKARTATIAPNFARNGAPSIRRPSADQ